MFSWWFIGFVEELIDFCEEMGMRAIGSIEMSELISVIISVN